MSEPQIRQVKLSNGEEIIGEFIDWSPYNQDTAVIAENVFLLMHQTTEYDQETVTRYAFRPWMALQDDISAPVCINMKNIISWYTPDESFTERYKELVENTKLIYAEAKENNTPLQGNVVRFSPKSDD
jgi:hypothetical protein